MMHATATVDYIIVLKGEIWAILDKVVDDYIPVADAIEDDVEEVEKDVFDDDIPAPTSRIYNLKREVIELITAWAAGEIPWPTKDGSTYTPSSTS